MSAVLHVILEAKSCLKGDAADDTADPPTSYQLG